MKRTFTVLSMEDEDAMDHIAFSLNDLIIDENGEQVERSCMLVNAALGAIDPAFLLETLETLESLHPELFHKD